MSIKSDLASGLEPRTIVVRAGILAVVQRQMFCAVTNEVLDIGTCVAVVGGPQQDDVIGVVSPTAWAAKKDGMLGVLASHPGLSLWIGGVEQF